MPVVMQGLDQAPNIGKLQGGHTPSRLILIMMTMMGKLENPAIAKNRDAPRILPACNQAGNQQQSRTI